MLMNDLLRTELFSLLAKNSQEVSNDEIMNAYESFVERIKILNQSENNYTVIIRTLNLTRIELLALQAENLYEQGKKCIEKSILAKSNHLFRDRVSTH